MKKIIIALGACFILSVGIIFILHALSTEMIFNNNSFIRIFPSHAMDQQDHAIDLKFNSYYIAGADRDHVYLSNYIAPLTMLIANSALTDTQRVRLKIKNLDKLRFTAITVKIDSPYFYITDGVLPGIFRGRVGIWEADRFMSDSVYFSAAIPITPNSFALRANARTSKEDFLLKHSKIPTLSKRAPELLQKQIDGVFCTDGMIIKSSELNELVYLYYYRNQFIVADTSFNLKYRAHTIDTVTKAKIKVSHTTSGEYNTSGLASPSAVVNRQVCTFRKWLFVNSNLMSRNDTKESFQSGAVVDVYDLENSGAYKFSFRLYDHNGKRMHSFLASPNNLFVINGSLLLSYKPAERYF